MLQLNIAGLDIDVSPFPFDFRVSLQTSVQRWDILRGVLPSFFRFRRVPNSKNRRWCKWQATFMGCHSKTLPPFPQVILQKNSYIDFSSPPLFKDCCSKSRSKFDSKEIWEMVVVATIAIF